MTDPFNCGSDTHFPEPETDIVEYDPDDEVMEKTPRDVIAILGFDPLGDEGDDAPVGEPDVGESKEEGEPNVNPEGEPKKDPDGQSTPEEDR